MSQNMIRKYKEDPSKVLSNLEKYEIFQVVRNDETADKINQYSDSIVKIGTEIARDILVSQQIPKNLFISSVDPSLLSNLKGGFGTAIFKDGKISEHAPFFKADLDLSKVVTPFIVMQVASIALGQHFMFEINNKLGKISKDIKEIKERLDDIEISKLETFERYLREKQNGVTKEHIFYIETEVQNTINNILGIFFKTIRSKMEQARKITASGFSLTASGSVEKLKKELQELELEKYIGIYQYAEFLLIFSIFLTWQYYISENNFEEADKVYKKIIQREKELDEDFKKIYYGYQQMRERIFEEMKKIQKLSDTKANLVDPLELSKKIVKKIPMFDPFGIKNKTAAIIDCVKDSELNKKVFDPFGIVDYIKDNEELFSPLRSHIENVPQRKSFMNTKQEVVYIQQDDKVFALIQKEQ